MSLINVSSTWCIVKITGCLALEVTSKDGEDDAAPL